MKKRLLKMMTGISIAMLMCLAGCGSKESEEISTENSEIPATEESVMAVKEEHTQEDFSKFGQIYYEEGYLYYYEGKYDPEIKRSSYTIKRNKINESAEQLARLENIKILEFCVPDGEGNLYLLYGTCEDAPVEEGIKSENSTESTGETTLDESAAEKATEKTTGTGKEEVYYYLEKRTVAGERLYAEKADAFTPFLESSIISTTVTEDGEVYALTMEGYILIWDAQGKEEESILTGWDMEQVSGNGKQCGIASTGGSAVTAYYCEGRTLYTHSVNKQSKKIMAPEEIKIPASGEKIISVSRDGKDGFFLVDQKQLWKYSRESKEVDLICEWNDKNINQQAEFIELVARKDAESYYLVLYDFFQDIGSVVTVEKMSTAQLPEGKEVVIGYLYYYSPDFDEVIKRYQKEQKEYYITWKKYDGAEDLKKAILLKEGPDILLLSDLMIGELTSKGILEDLSAWIDQSENLKKEDIIPSARKAGEYDGGWWYLFPNFIMETMVIKKGEISEEGITAEQFLNLETNEGMWLCETRNTLTNRDLLRRILLADIEHYLNWKDKKCYFDSEEFQQLLSDIAKVKKPEAETNNNLGLEEVNLLEGISKGYYLASFRNVSNATEYHFLKEAVGDVADITGYPNSTGQIKFLFNSYSAVGINSASKQKEGAWNFIEYMMLNFVQKSDGFDVNIRNFSTVESILDKQLRWRDTGEIIINNYNPYNDTSYQGAVELSEEEIQELRKIIDNASWSGMMEYSKFLDIIESEAEYFFHGDKTVEDVTKVIQSRIELMMNE